jgi:DNA sulfur modification protein DndC
MQWFTKTMAYRDIINSLTQLYVEDDRSWLVGFSGGKDSTMLASLIFSAVLAIPAGQRKKSISILCTDTGVEIPAIVEMVENTLTRMRKFSHQNDLNIEVGLLKPLPRAIILGEPFRKSLSDFRPR